LDQPDILNIIFHPRQENPLPSQDILDHDFQVDKDILVGARLHLTNSEFPNILFFHGNGEVSSDYDEFGAIYNKYGMNFLAVDYRGYGRSSGTPTVTHMIDDAHTIYVETKRLLEQGGYNGPLYIMGRSLGCSCAIELAGSYQDEIAGLIIDSGFSQTLPLLIALGVDIHNVGISEEEGFCNVQKISRINKPTFILHGQFDQIIPLSSAEILQANSPAKNKQFQVIPGADHNTIIEKVGEMYFAAIKQFMDKVQKIRRKRPYKHHKERTAKST